MTRLGIGSYTYPWAIGLGDARPAAPLSALGVLQRAIALGVRVVQYCDNLPLDALSADELAALLQQAAVHDIQLEVGTRGTQPEGLLAYLRLAQQVGAPLVRVVTDTATCHPTPEEIVRDLATVMPAYEAAGIALAVENHDRFSARAFVRMVTAIGSPRLGICLDTVNSFGALEGPEVVVQTLAPYVLNLHVKDFTIYRAASQLGFTIEGRPAGQGRLDVPWVLETLRAAGRTPNAILELWTPAAATPAETIAREAQWAQESVAYLRSMIAE